MGLEPIKSYEFFPIFVIWDDIGDWWDDIGLFGAKKIETKTIYYCLYEWNDYLIII